MTKNITLLVIAKGEHTNMIDLAESAIKMATYPGQVQIVFAVGRNDSPCINAAHRLSAEYPLDLFDPVHLPTIKLMGWDTGLPTDEMYEKMKPKADASIVMPVEDYIQFRTKGWDKQILEEFDIDPSASGIYFNLDGRWINIEKIDKKQASCKA